MNQIERLIEQTDTALRWAEDATIKRVNLALETAYKQLERDLLKAYTKHAPDKSLLPSQRKLLILSQLSDLLQLLNPKQSERIQKDFENLLRGSYESGLTLSGQLAQAISSQELQSFAAVPVEAIRFQAEEGMKRLSRYTAEFASKASAIVEMGLAQGWGGSKVAGVLRTQLGITKTNAEMIARTETLSAHNDAIQANLARNGFETFLFMATADDRLCPYCSARNQRVYKLGQSKPPIHPRCLPGDVTVSAPVVKAGTSREYIGEVVCIETASGKELTATPNHPVLTDKGWIAIGLLNEGDHVFSSINSEEITRTVAPDKYNRPALIEEIVTSFRESSGVSSRSVEVSSEDFHGDGVGSEVSVVSANSLLWDDVQSQFSQPLPKQDLILRLVQKYSLLANRLLDFDLPRNRPTFSGQVGAASLQNPFLWGHLLPFQQLSFRLRSRLNSRPLNNLPNSRSLYFELLRNRVLRHALNVETNNVSPNSLMRLHESLNSLLCGNCSALTKGSHQPSFPQSFSKDNGSHLDDGSGILNRFPGQIFRDRIVKTIRRDFSGHVYNLETQAGWYFANDILTHNCRCVAVPHKQEWIDLGLVDAAEMRQFRAEGLAELKAQGKQPNYGVSPFERMAGLEKPPEPVG